MSNEDMDELKSIFQDVITLLYDAQATRRTVRDRRERQNYTLTLECKGKLRSLGNQATIDRIFEFWEKVNVKVG